MKVLLILFGSLCVSASQDAAEQEFATANNLFAGSLYKEIRKNKDGNFLVSPFSAEVILAFAQSGAKGQTGEEVRNALHLPNDKDRVESALKSLLPKFKSNDYYSLHTANKMYVKENFTVNDGFKDSATSVYGADVESVDFERNVDAANKINSWVEKQTNEKIKNLISSQDLDEYTRAVLVNALYFKANWSSPFRLESTQKRKFYRTPTDVVQVDTLHQYEDQFNYYDNTELKAEFLELPFKGGEASMVIVLPKDRDGLEHIEQKLDQVFDLQQPMASTYLNVALPKFKIESSIDLKSVLQKLGVKSAFDEQSADLSGIAGNKGDLIIDKVKQKTFVDVSEEGVEAAAATYVVVAVPVSALIGPKPRDFIADHPFIFYIKVKNLIVFAGRVTSPEV